MKAQTKARPGVMDDVFRRVAIIWGAYLNMELTPADAAFMLELLKLARQATKLGLDELIDAAGLIGPYSAGERRANYR